MAECQLPKLDVAGSNPVARSNYSGGYGLRAVTPVVRPSRRTRGMGGAQMVRRILHPSDFSPASQAAFRKAVELAKQSHAELLVLHVLDPIVFVVGEGYVSPRTYDSIVASTRASAKRHIDRHVARARAAGVRAGGMLMEGLAHAQILRAAKSKRVDLIVMGTHGRSGLARFFIGSVAARVVSSARCPVLTVRGK